MLWLFIMLKGHFAFRLCALGYKKRLLWNEHQFVTEHGLSFCRTKFVTPQNGGPCCADRISSDNWLNHRHITSVFINLICFMNVEFTRKGTVKSDS